MKQLEKTFERAGFVYALVKRDGAAAFYTKVFVSKPDGASWFEVVRLIQGENGDEAFPPPTSWGILGVTFPSSKEVEAEQKYEEFVNEYGEAALASIAAEAKAKVNNSKIEESVAEPIEASKTDLVSNKKQRGRRKLEVEFNLPETGAFQAKDLAESSNMSLPFVHNRLQAMKKAGLIEIQERVQGRRGKAVILWRKTK